MNDDSTEAKSTNVDAEILERIREILNKNNCQSGQSQGIVNLFRRLLSLPENEQTEDGNYHEIIPRLFLGDFQLAMNPTKLKKLGFTHVLNAAEGRKFGQINTCATFYEEASIEYLGFPILDTPRYQINKHFSRTIEFLSKALEEKKSRIYVHCQQGISRSATLVLAFLLQTEEKLSLLDVVQLVSSRRPIRPNDGFCRELIRFEREIRTTNNSDRPSNETEIE